MEINPLSHTSQVVGAQKTSARPATPSLERNDELSISQAGVENAKKIADWVSKIHSMPDIPPPHLTRGESLEDVWGTVASKVAEEVLPTLSQAPSS